MNSTFPFHLSSTRVFRNIIRSPQNDWIFGLWLDDSCFVGMKCASEADQLCQERDRLSLYLHWMMGKVISLLQSGGLWWKKTKKMYFYRYFREGSSTLLTRGRIGGRNRLFIPFLWSVILLRRWWWFQSLLKWGRGGEASIWRLDPVFRHVFRLKGAADCVLLLMFTGSVEMNAELWRRVTHPEEQEGMT